MKFHYRCTSCGATYDISPQLMLCPVCSRDPNIHKPLSGILALEFVGVPPGSAPDPLDFLPIEKEYFPELPVGNTHLIKPKRLCAELGFAKFYVKDDTHNPTSSFKDRASYAVAGFARQRGIEDIVVASTGNAASSMAGIGAAAGLHVTIFIPRTAPVAKIAQSLQYGANVVLVDGNYDRAYDLSTEFSAIKGGMSRNTAYNPFTVEGKKTVSVELFNQLGRAPDRVFVPTGDGVILCGVYKGFADLIAAKYIEKMPRIYAVQAEGSNAIARAFESGDFNIAPAKTIADSISVDVPKAGYLALQYMSKFDGKCTVVSDEEILSAQKHLSGSSGIFVEPAAAAAFAGFLAEKNNIRNDETIVVLATGNGLKDIDAALQKVAMPRKPITSVEEIL
jgi:threonine synthase